MNKSSNRLDRSVTRSLLRKEGITLSPTEKDGYTICKACGKEFGFGDDRKNLEKYIYHVKVNHPEYAGCHIKITVK